VGMPGRLLFKRRIRALSGKCDRAVASWRTRLCNGDAIILSLHRCGQNNSACIRSVDGGQALRVTCDRDQAYMAIPFSCTTIAPDLYPKRRAYRRTHSACDHDVIPGELV